MGLTQKEIDDFHKKNGYVLCVKLNCKIKPEVCVKRITTLETINKKGFQVLASAKYLTCIGCKEGYARYRKAGSPKVRNKRKRVTIRESYISAVFDEMSDFNLTKKCQACGEELPMSVKYFGLNKTTDDGYQNTCRECNRPRFERGLVSHMMRHAKV